MRILWQWDHVRIVLVVTRAKKWHVRFKKTHIQDKRLVAMAPQEVRGVARHERWLAKRFWQTRRLGAAKAFSIAWREPV